jgi:exodeoxyribonuclease VII large subunit
METSEDKGNSLSILSVSELTSNIKETLEAEPDLQNIWVKGEVSNLTKHSSGNIYFSLKDSSSQIPCSFLKWSNKNLDFDLKDGIEIIAFGSINVYSPYGRYQLLVRELRELGIGEIKLKLELLRKQLFEEGIFDPEKKKPLPFFPLRLGVATAPTSAAFRDIIRVVTTKNPNISIVIAPCKVQGEDSAKSIIRAIEELNNPKWEIDVIIVGRGGGSFEDLLSFSDEGVTRAVVKSRVPIVSAVGHEIDHPIIDEAADFAAPTPSAAADKCIPDYYQLVEHIQNLANRFLSSLRNKKENSRELFRYLTERPYFKNYHKLLEEKSQYLDDLYLEMKALVKEQVSSRKNMLDYSDKIKYVYKNIIAQKINYFLPQKERLINFSPIATLKRGFSITRDLKTKMLIQNTKSVKEERDIEVLFYDGTIEAGVKKINKKAPEDILKKETH